MASIKINPNNSVMQKVSDRFNSFYTNHKSKIQLNKYLELPKSI